MDEKTVFLSIGSEEVLLNLGLNPGLPDHWQTLYSFKTGSLVLVGRMSANGLEDRGSIPGQVIPKTLKMVFDTSLLNIQQYKVCIKGIVEQSRERSCTLPYASV